MRLWLLIATLVTIIIFSMVWLYRMTGAQQREVETMLKQFAMTVATHDLAKIREALGRLIADDAKITLDVKFHSLAQPEGGSLMSQQFTKETFIPFIETTLYPLTDYSYNPTLTAFAKDDAATATVEIVSQDRAHGVSHYGSIGISARFGADTRCTGKVSYAGDTPQLQQAQCSVRLISVPKQEDLRKLVKP